MNNRIIRCRKCRETITKAPPSQVRWGAAPGLELCPACRSLARRAAHHARKRDPQMCKLVRAMHRHFGRELIWVDKVLPMAESFGRNRAALEALFIELGPEVDGLLEQVAVGSLVLYRFVAGRVETVASNRESVASASSRAGAVGPAGTENAPQPPDDGEGSASPILDNNSPMGIHPVSVRDQFDAAEFIEDLTPVLDDAREAGEALFRVSLTMPHWHWQAVDAAADQFKKVLMAKGARAVFLSKDISKEGAPHWYGLVVMHVSPTPKATRHAIELAWIQASGAHSGCMRIHKVTGWDAFVASGGDLHALVGKQSFYLNLVRVTQYAFKNWPPCFGRRDLHRDVVSAGAMTLNVMSAATPLPRAA